MYVKGGWGGGWGEGVACQKQNNHPFGGTVIVTPV